MSRPSGQATSRLCLLVANEPRCYREAIAAAFRMLKPLVEVIAVGPEALDLQVERRVPHLVICSRATPTVQDAVRAWIELYPDGGPLSSVSIHGELSTKDGIELPDLLSIFDRAQSPR